MSCDNTTAPMHLQVWTKHDDLGDSQLQSNVTSQCMHQHYPGIKGRTSVMDINCFGQLNQDPIIKCVCFGKSNPKCLQCMQTGNICTCMCKTMELHCDKNTNGTNSHYNFKPRVDHHIQRTDRDFVQNSEPSLTKADDGCQENLMYKVYTNTAGVDLGQSDDILWIGAMDKPWDISVEQLDHVDISPDAGDNHKKPRNIARNCNNHRNSDLTKLTKRSKDAPTKAVPPLNPDPGSITKKVSPEGRVKTLRSPPPGRINPWINPPCRNWIQTAVLSKLPLMFTVILLCLLATVR